MTCQKLYAEHFKQYEKQETEMFNQIMHLQMVEQETCERNLSLEQGNDRLEANVEKLRFQLQQKNINEGNLPKTFLAQKKELKALDENKILKLENELIKDNGKTKLDNEKLKDTIKSIKALHKDQIQMKDVRISELNSTIKSIKTKLKGQKKSLEKLHSKVADFQCQSATNIAKLEHKKN